MPAKKNPITGPPPSGGSGEHDEVTHTAETLAVSKRKRGTARAAFTRALTQLQDLHTEVLPAWIRKLNLPKRERGLAARRRFSWRFISIKCSQAADVARWREHCKTAMGHQIINTEL